MADIDWGLVAAIVALLAIPLQLLAIPPFLHWIKRFSRNLARIVWPRNDYCRSLGLEHFDSGPLHPSDALHNGCRNLCTIEMFEKSLSSRRWSDSLHFFFPLAWLQKNLVRKPLALPFAKKYIRVDVEVLLLYVYVMASSSSSAYIPTPAEWFENMLDLVQCGDVMIARRRWATLRRPGVYSFDASHFHLSKMSGQQIHCCFGNKTYDENTQLKLLTGRNIQHPLIAPNAYRRGGWIVALGMSHNYPNESFDNPSPLLPFAFCGQLVEAPFRNTYGEGPFYLTPDVANALRRVKDTIELRLHPAFPESTEVRLAVDLVNELYTNYAEYAPFGSKQPIEDHKLFWSFGDDTLTTDYLKDADAELCAKIVEFFNSLAGLKEEDKLLFEGELPGICRCAIKGLFMAIEFYRTGRHCVEPDLLKRYTHVYLEDEFAIE
ncbi:hypothetical protein AK830_g2639 [Neonectria ditissima]|uniref:Uncharacterized protein n=1 Tax=Neonectria ditissima TaxID=78410 RepID=A0A0P7BEH0_9HYPO|nr:hypothetical protein AK830_g2639 [Neonectria ditissima]